jgi:hypothetical protein
VTRIKVTGVGDVSLEELEAMLFAYVNAGAPKPVLQGSLQEIERILKLVASRGDAQMRTVVESMLKEYRKSS